MPTETPAITGTPSLKATDTPLPVSPTPSYAEIDLDVDMPYVQNVAALPPGALARIGIGQVGYQSFFPDQSHMVLVTSTGLFAYDPASFDLVWQHYWARSPSYVSLSQDGSRIVASYGFEAGPDLIDAATGHRIAKLDGWYGPIPSPDGNLLAVEERPSLAADINPPFTARIWFYDSVTGQALRALEATVSRFYGSVFHDRDWSPEGAYFAACTDDTVYIWDTQSTNLLHTISPASQSDGSILRCLTVAFNPESTHLAVEDTQRLTVIDVSTGGTTDYPTDDSRLLAWLPGGLLLEGDLFRILDADPRMVNGWTLSPSGSQLAVVASDGIRVLSADSLEVEYAIDMVAEGVQWSPSGTWLVGRQDNMYTIFNTSSGEQVFESLEPVNGSLQIDERYLLDRSLYRVTVVDLLAQEVVSAARIGVDVGQLTWSQDGETLILSGADGEWYWSENTGNLTSIRPAGLEMGPSLAFELPDWREHVRESLSPDGALHAVANIDAFCGDGPWGGGCGIWGGTLALYENSAEEPMVTLTDPGGGVTAMAWSADSTMLAYGLGSAEGTLANNRVGVLDARSGAEIFVFEGHLGDISGLLFSPDGTRLASASGDGTVIVWNTAR